jgi:alkylated DNA nucleotide flippase Atl1
MPETPETRLARAMSEALLAYAEEKARQETPMTEEDQPVMDAALPALRGARQREVTDLLAAAPSEGWKTGEIARMVGMDQPNAYLTLQALQKQDVVELVPGSDPQRWRLVARYRQRQQILRVAKLVREGEYTTYGDISQVVYGHPKGAQAVGRVAARLPEFPKAHRILEQHGLIPLHWKHTDGTGDPKDAARLLEQDGVGVLKEKDGRFYAHPRHHVGHETLSARLREELIPDRTAEDAGE